MKGHTKDGELRLKPELSSPKLSSLAQASPSNCPNFSALKSAHDPDVFRMTFDFTSFCLISCGGMLK